MIVTQKEIAPKKYNPCSPERTLVSGKEKQVSEIEPELKVPVDAGLKRLEVICTPGEASYSL